MIKKQFKNSVSDLANSLYFKNVISLSVKMKIIGLVHKQRKSCISSTSSILFTLFLSLQVSQLLVELDRFWNTYPRHHEIYTRLNTDLPLRCIKTVVLTLCKQPNFEVSLLYLIVRLHILGLLSLPYYVKFVMPSLDTAQ